MDNKKILFKIRAMKQYFPVRGRRNTFVKANDGIDLDIYDGETIGIVGESGCGKSTLGRALLQLYKLTSGSVLYFGKSLDDVAPLYITKTVKSLKYHRKHIADLLAAYKSKTAELEKDPENYAKIEAANIAKRRYNAAYFPVVTLLGGLFVKQSVDVVQKAYLDMYDVSKKQVQLRRRIAAVELDIAELDYASGSPKKREKLVAIKAELEQKERKMHEQVEKKQVAIDALRDAHKDDPEFMEHEQHRSDGIDLALLTNSEMRTMRKDMQIIFQDPYSSLNPRMTVGQIISEGMRTHNFFKKNAERQQEFTINIMEECGLAPYMLHRYPNQFSGGQRQRIGIARALALRPHFVVCDEAVSALDVSIQSQIINLLQDLREKSNLAYMFISHDLSVIRYLSDRVGVMYVGNFVEIASTEKLFAKPAHPYTVALLEAIPTTDAEGAKKDVKILEGDIPSPVNPPSGCKFHTRCTYATDKCKNIVPQMEEIDEGHFVACHYKLNH
jgi:peptide/nickel transport system ATP-binding protein